MKVVCDSSPLIALARISRLEILKELFTRIAVPAAVWRETALQTHAYAGVFAIRQCDWIDTVEIHDTVLVQALGQELDAGEAEAIALAIQTSADLLIMDELLGREVARHMGVQITGLLGCLLIAKHRQIVSRVVPILEQLRDAAGFRISGELFDKISRTAGE